MQSLEKTLTLAWLAPFFMLSSTHTKHASNPQSQSLSSLEAHIVNVFL